jgi:hypothetical protein
VIAGFRIRGEYSIQILLGQNPFGQSALISGQRQFRGRVRGNVMHPVTEAKEAFDRRQRPHARNGRQAGFDQRLRELLEVGESYAEKGLVRVI